MPHSILCPTTLKELVIKGMNVTEIFSVGGAFSSVVETQVVTMLNSLRNLWDPDNEYFRYAFIRQSQTFPDVVLRNLQDEREVLFGIELKSWYVLSKEGETSFRYQITPEACADADLIVIIPWILSDVISGMPTLRRPFTELAGYAAEYRSYHWQRSRIENREKALVPQEPDSGEETLKFSRLSLKSWIAWKTYGESFHKSLPSSMRLNRRPMESKL